jgi:accessory gene regulator protein AgrB
VFLTRTAGYAFNEVVVALAGKPGGHRSLRRCGYGIAAVATMVMLLLAATPLGEWWFGTVTGLSPELTALASASLLFAVLMPGYAVAQNYHQGLLVHNHRTRPITEAVVLYLVICSICLVIGVEYLQDVQGIQVALGSFTIAGLMQTTWLLLRRRGMPQQEITAG